MQITRESGAPEQPVSNPQWSPDGRFVAYQAVGGLFVIDPCGRPVRLAAEVSNYSWSNDSTRIASDNSEGIFIADSMSAVLRGIGSHWSWRRRSSPSPLGRASPWVAFCGLTSSLAL